MTKVMTVKAWNRLPSEFGLCAPKDDLLIMAALEKALVLKGNYEALLEKKAYDRIKKT